MLDDTDRIMQVMEQAFDPAYGEAWNRRQLSASLILPTTWYYLVGADGNAPSGSQEAAGFALTRAAPGEEELLLVGVLPQFRGQGLGRKLLTLFEHGAKLRQAERIFLEMRANNPARKLYEAFGFQPIGRRKDYYRASNGERIDAITYGKSL
ncbi:ribosomal protein S18-alanine N-acetyltransferase [Pontixanthobacter gangjinensis]|uniref:GNAT family N-acetyltransferase n=1 Tax=Pontixanthobacter gangjinensis TaxID=1028742 RepID=A0A6I4SPH4_9SPHN|nr:GNAT family N-acetyltransferase [Pontixanthobacter gangjinensis]MXO56582.1 GNAT family N-acetyltransferase [Pontixanthobacter gangjinensis]